MKTKIKLLKDYGDHKAGEIMMAEKDGADALVAQGIAEIVAPDVEVTKELDIIAEKVEKAVADAVKKEVKNIPLPKIEVKEVPIYSEGDRGGGEFLLDVKAACTGGGMSERMLKYGAMLAEKAPSGNSTLVNTDGGYLVPDEFNTMLMDEMAIEAKIAPRTRQVPINSRIRQERP